MKRSPIPWTDYSGGNLNFVIGCTPVSAGCHHCYARRLYDRWGKDFSQVRLYPEKLERLRTQQFWYHSEKRGIGYQPMVFPVDMGDLFHHEVPNTFVEEALATMAIRKDLVWQVLTKRPVRMRRFLDPEGPRPGAVAGRMLDWLHRRGVRGDAWHDATSGTLDPTGFHLGPGFWPLRNLWAGVTVEDVATMWRIAVLAQTAAVVRWLSLEPLLERLDVRKLRSELGRGGTWWVVVGAETGPNRRPFRVEWAQEVRDLCGELCIPFFGKQDSGLYPGEPLLLREGYVQEWPDH